MTTYCVMCRELIPEARAYRGSHFCSNDCHKSYRKQRRAWRSQKVCRFCGNGITRRRAKTQTSAAVGDLHSEQQPDFEIVEDGGGGFSVVETSAPGVSPAG